MRRPSKNSGVTAHKERGVVLLTTLLIMTIMATLAVAIIDDMRFAVKRTGNAQSHAQAQWYIRAAQDFAQSYIETNIVGLEPAAINGFLKAPSPTILPIDGGNIVLSVTDGSQCLSLGSLADSPGRAQFRILLTVIGLDSSQAANITSAVIDWQDADTQALPGGAEDYAYLGLSPDYRTANTNFSSVMELRAVQGITSEIYDAISPYICARGGDEISRININTLRLDQAPLLASVLGVEHKELAIQLISERPSAGYESVETLRASSVLEGLDQSDFDFDSFVSFEPDALWVEANIVFLEASRFVAIDFSIVEGRVTPLSRFLSVDARRPLIQKAPT